VSARADRVHEEREGGGRPDDHDDDPDDDADLEDGQDRRQQPEGEPERLLDSNQIRDFGARAEVPLARPLWLRLGHWANLIARVGAVGELAAEDAPCEFVDMCVLPRVTAPAVPGANRAAATAMGATVNPMRARGRARVCLDELVIACLRGVGGLASGGEYGRWLERFEPTSVV
jgi:hypothetical protein